MPPTNCRGGPSRGLVGRVAGTVTVRVLMPDVPDRRLAAIVSFVGACAALVGTLGLAAAGRTLLPARAEADPAPVATRPAPPAAPVVPATDGALPVGKGMWLYLPEKSEGGDVNLIVARAREVGLTHLYVRTGSSRMGFYAQPFLDRLLPVAHAAGLRVYGWDFPYLDDPAADAARGMWAAQYTTPSGDRIDGFVADIETPSEGTNLSPHTALQYGDRLRRWVGDAYPLIVAVPRPSAKMLAKYPYAEVVAAFDAIAPMVYWLNRQPDTDAADAVARLSAFGKPIIPVGQAYDGSPEGGRPGVPPRDELIRFMQASERAGATGVSFWSWQHATIEAWVAIRDAGEFRFPAVPPERLRPSEVKSVTSVLGSMGYDAPLADTWTPEVAGAVAAFQADAGLPATGIVDDATRSKLLAPVPPPIVPVPVP